MAKGKKPEEKPKEGTQLTIDVGSFLRTRDSVRLLSLPSFLLLVLLQRPAHCSQYARR
jgi:hypothetical protein